MGTLGRPQAFSWAANIRTVAGVQTAAEEHFQSKRLKKAAWCVLSLMPMGNMALQVCLPWGKRQLNVIFPILWQ